MSDNQFIVTSGYQALHKSSAIVDLTSRSRIRVTGEDRARLLHALTTNHIQQMNPGDELYAFFLTAQGRIISDVTVTCLDDYFLLEVEPEVLETVLKHIDHYIIADDVTLEDVSQTTFSLSAQGRRLHGELSQKQETIARIGLVQATPEEARTFRIESFQPRYGEDITAATLPQETGLAKALHFNKGCYLGQEIVERIRSRGHVNKMLVGLAIKSDSAPTPGSKVLFEGAECGEITSSTWSQHFNEARAIAMLRTQATLPGAIVQVNGATAEVAAVS
jgi:folate-binding protein YgfZ